MSNERGGRVGFCWDSKRCRLKFVLINGCFSYLISDLVMVGFWINLLSGRSIQISNFAGFVFI